MKRNILHTFVLLSALALASCSTTNKVASNQKVDDDVYFSKAEAGEAPVYRQPVSGDLYTQSNTGDDDYYYYYDSYSSRINRFGYNSPFDYYDDYYYGYSPYAYNNPYGYAGVGSYGGGWGLGLGLGYGYGGYGYGGFGYNPWGYGYGLGYGYGGLYSPYSYWGTGYGYGGGYWGVYSANNTVARARPYRGSGFPSSNTGGRTSGRPVGYNGNYPNTMSYPGRRTSSVEGNTYGGNGARPTRGAASPQPVYRPQRTEVSRPTYQPASVDRSMSSGSQSSGSSSSGGGGGGSRGGGRPSRP
ncbi:hypothetical protein [Mucilaginibacter sp. PAMB04168]|uniref:hypothetical protein n=1 Tax=Mucilaginibacter sp. PAMB04168 TaxID=3138567 RepID=UPI0031F65AE1